MGLAKVTAMEWISQDAIISTVCICYLGVVLKCKRLVDCVRQEHLSLWWKRRKTETKDTHAV